MRPGPALKRSEVCVRKHLGIRLLVLAHRGPAPPVPLPRGRHGRSPWAGLRAAPGMRPGGGEDGDLLPPSGPGAQRRGSLPGEAGPAAALFCLSDRPSICRRLWFPGLGECLGPPERDAESLLPFLPRASPQVIRISTSTVRPMQGRAGPAAGHGTARTD